MILLTWIKKLGIGQSTVPHVIRKRGKMRKRTN